jgi:predicted ATPase
VPDLKGSMELLVDRDPEEARQLLDPVLERMMAAVHRYEGTVNQLNLDKALQDTLPALLSLLDALPEDSPFLQLDPPQCRQRTLDALKRVMLCESHAQPLLLVCEDLHWIDSETQSLLGSLMKSLPIARLLAMALCFAAMFHQFRREAPAARELAEVAVALATEQGLLQYIAAGTFLQGWALIAQGQGADGLVQLRQGIATYRATGTVLDLPWYLGVLADGYGSTGQVDAGLAALAEALAVVDTTDFYEAELYRLKGALLLGRRVPDAFEAEASFQRALAIGRHQQAKSLELRAAKSLISDWASTESPLPYCRGLVSNLGVSSSW